MIQDFLYLKEKNIKEVLELILESYVVTSFDTDFVLQDLLIKKIVSQKKGKKDGREKLLFLADKGNELSKQIFDTQKRRILYAFKNSTPEDVLSFKNVLIKIIK